MDKRKLQLATVIQLEDKAHEDGIEPLYTIRVLNMTEPVKVPISHLVPCTSCDPADIPLAAKDIDPNAIEILVTKEDLERLWHRDQ
eukprot:1368688-Ditylum_brightwellii.AAC.1